MPFAPFHYDLPTHRHSLLVHTVLLVTCPFVLHFLTFGLVARRQTIFLIISVSAVITNAALTVFTMDTLDGFSFQFRMWVFIGFQWACFALQMIIMAVIPDVPEEIDIQLQRTDFIVDKLIDKVGDDDDSEYVGENADVAFQTYPLIGGFYAKHLPKKYQPQ